jgi:hypothetical protein
VKKNVFFILLSAAEMERTLGDLGPDDWENGIQVGLYNGLSLMDMLCQCKLILH